MIGFSDVIYAGGLLMCSLFLNKTSWTTLKSSLVCWITSNIFYGSVFWVYNIQYHRLNSFLVRSHCKSFPVYSHLAVRHFDASVSYAMVETWILYCLCLSLKPNNFVLCKETGYIPYFYMAYLQQQEKVSVVCKYLLMLMHQNCRES